MIGIVTIMDVTTIMNMIATTATMIQRRGVMGESLNAAGKWVARLYV
jgi:hypothetical protein